MQLLSPFYPFFKLPLTPINLFLHLQVLALPLYHFCFVLWPSILNQVHICSHGSWTTYWSLMMIPPANLLVLFYLFRIVYTTLVFCVSYNLGFVLFCFSNSVQNHVTIINPTNLWAWQAFHWGFIQLIELFFSCSMLIEHFHLRI